VSANGTSSAFAARWREAVESTSSSVSVDATEPRSRSVARRRSPITRSVSSLTTQSMPAMRPSSSVSGL
jgi:hypothetical protein